MKPIIGIIPLFDDEKNSIWMVPGYLEGIQISGGIPVILPLKASDEDLLQLCNLCSGFLFTGGHDVDPALYGEEKKDTCGNPNADRDLLEKRIFDYALSSDKSVLGICRGIQLINALSGGTLYQDIPTEYKSSVNHHMKPPYDVPCHKVTILKDTPLSSLFEKDELFVNSYHHQGVKKIAPGLKAMAVAEDGLVEALYHPDRKFIQAVQWHPEFIYKVDEDSRRLLKAFVQSCGQ